MRTIKQNANLIILILLIMGVFMLGCSKNPTGAEATPNQVNNIPPEIRDRTSNVSNRGYLIEKGTNDLGNGYTLKTLHEGMVGTFDRSVYILYNEKGEPVKMTSSSN